MKPNRILRFEMPYPSELAGPRPCGCKTDEREYVIVDSLTRFKEALTLKPYDTILCIKGMARLDAVDAMEAAHAACPEVTFQFLTSKAADAWAGSPGKDELPISTISGKVGPLEAKGVKDTAAPSRSLDLRILDRLRVLSEGDEAGLFLDLVCSFLEKSQEKIGALGKSAELRDFPSLAKAAHGMKGLSLNFGALAMTRKCDALQSAAETGNCPAVMEALAGLKDALTDTRIAFSGLPGLDGQETRSAKPAVEPDKWGTDVRKVR